MADEELAPDGDEALELERDEDQQEEREPTASEIAARMGWRPKDEWQGDPEAWKPADKFILDGGDIQKTTSRELKAVRDQLDRIGNVTETIIQDKVAQARSEWEAKIRQAAIDGDEEATLALARQQPGAPQQRNGADPTVAAWVAQRPWMNTDPAAAAVARAVSEQYASLPVERQLEEAEKAVRARFPEHFPRAAKDPPATQTGSSRKAAPSNKIKGFADMPDDAQKLARDYEDRLNVKKEDFAKSYWRNREGVSR